MNRIYQIMHTWRTRGTDLRYLRRGTIMLYNAKYIKYTASKFCLRTRVFLLLHISETIYAFYMHTTRYFSHKEFCLCLFLYVLCVMNENLFRSSRRKKIYFFLFFLAFVFIYNIHTLIIFNNNVKDRIRR